MTKFIQKIVYRSLACVHKGVKGLINLILSGIRLLFGPLPWQARLGVLFFFLAFVSLILGAWGPSLYTEWAGFLPVQLEALEQDNLFSPLKTVFVTFRLVALFMFAAGVLSFIRRLLTYLFLRVAAAFFTATWIALLVQIVAVPSNLYLSHDKIFDKFMRNDLWMQGTWIWLSFFVVAAVLLTCLSLSRVKAHYGGEVNKSTLGDRVWENLKSHGRDPQFRASVYWSTFLHVFILFVLPLISFRGCSMAPYAVPKGSGNPVVRMVRVKKIKKKKIKKYVFNPNSAISFYRPDVKDNILVSQLDDLTKATYETSAMKGGRLGKGGGKQGGWPKGMKNAKVRFIRLKYAGGDWDQQMGKGTDYNFLVHFREITGFAIANKTEAIRVTELKKFPKHRAPPFVYITGQKNIRLSSYEIKMLRWYLTEEGGMLFADNGGGRFNRAFRRLMRRAFPNKQLIDIANDDIIYRQPFYFPNGAPPLWHHSGNRALGIRHQGRWVVFYHQGDINDAWQTGGSGVSPRVRLQAFKMGINVVNYAFNQYMAKHF